jgi:hypothetical protein
MATLGQFTSISKSGDCTGTRVRARTLRRRSPHGMILIGVGGDAILGKDK